MRGLRGEALSATGRIALPFPADIQHAMTFFFKQKTAYEILFAFTGAAGTVVEIKRLGLPADAPRSRKYQWLWIAAGSNPQQALPLQFVSMSQGDRHERVFAEGTLRFGERDAQWSLQASEAQHHL